MRRGNLFVISGPSGAGKGTLVARLVSQMPDAWVSVSVTTRAPRTTERAGIDYSFVTKDEFDRLVKADGLLEWAEVHGCCYGTPRKTVEDKMLAGKQVILEIDVQGAFQVRQKLPQAHLVFIEPPSMDELERRLRQRGTETPEEIGKRLRTAHQELAHKAEYDFRLMNDDLDEACRRLAAYVDEKAERETPVI
ncbi:MAG: guanylate kinase [Coriobacteriaceae bacterium]|jgi:guanylate kinase|nr:guanylate kinase [Coriobacteriaceae bacterium]